MPQENPEFFFLQEKPSLALLAIAHFGRTYASVITKEINSTFAHTTKILCKMEEIGLVQFSVEGRIKYVELTEKGYEVMEYLKGLILSLGGEIPERFLPEDEIPDRKSELDDVSAEVMDKIDELRGRIKNAHQELLESDAGVEAFNRRLGPFSRDIKLLDELIGSANVHIDHNVITAFESTRELLDSLKAQS